MALVAATLYNATKPVFVDLATAIDFIKHRRTGLFYGFGLSELKDWKPKSSHHSFCVLFGYFLLPTRSS
jgi:hypothetical protein